MLDSLNSVLAIAMVVFGLGLVIFLHELGHFVMAKRNKVKVEIFSLGFGPAIWSFRRGDTEYRLSWVPLGGYVKMAGENVGDDRSGESWELTSKTPWQRFQIFVAGAVMNLLLAVPLAVLAFYVGRYEVMPTVARPGTAEARAEAVSVDGEPLTAARRAEYNGMRPGDIVFEVDGRKIETLQKYRIEMVRRTSGQKVPVHVRRGDKEIVLQVETHPIPYHMTTVPVLLMKAKVLRAVSDRLEGNTLSPAEEALVRDLKSKGATLEIDGRDRIKYDVMITSLNGKPIYSRTDVFEAFQKNPEKPIRVGLTWQDESEKFHEGETTFIAPKRTVYAIPGDNHLMPPVVGSVIPGTPAEGNIEAGDVIEKVDGKDIRSWQDLLEAVKPHPGKPLKFSIREKPEVTITPAISEQGSGMIGITPDTDEKTYPEVAEVAEGSFYALAGLKTGDLISGFEGKQGAIRLQHGGEKEPGIMGRRSDKELTIKIDVKRGDETIPLILEAKAQVEGDMVALGLPHQEGSRAIEFGSNMFFKQYPFGEAVNAGLWEPVDIGVMTFQFLYKLVTGQASPKMLSGPVGIAHASYQFAELYVGNFIWLLCVITVNLGIFNLLPIPVLDGGHNVLLFIEVVRKWFGKPPPSEKFVATFQYVGLLFILALVVFVTFNDISRLF